MHKQFLKYGARALAAASILAPFIVAAQVLPPPPITTPQTAINTLCLIAGWMFTFLIVFAIIFVILAAFNYLTAGGDPEKVKTASNQLIYAAVAVAVAIFAKGLPLLVSGLLGSNIAQQC
jgi:magnesium-transporting ATPase (P-type)